MQSHLGDLRAEVEKEFGTTDETWLHTIRDGWHSADLNPLDKALCAYAEKLTLTPAAMAEADLETLRAHGLDDPALHDAIQVISFFNYINRIADATHVDLDPGMDPR